VPFRCDAVVFDLDGVLVDSNAIAERQMRVWAERHGVAFARVAAIHHGRPTIETIRLVAPHLDAEAEARLVEAAEVDDTDGLSVFAGASRLLDGLPGTRWAIVTSGTRRLATTRLDHVGLRRPAVLVTADDVRRGKPAPDPYLLAAERLGLEPRRCVVVEDAPAGVAAARAAGARVIGVASTMAPAVLEHADVVVARLDDLDIAIGSATLRITWRAAVRERDATMYTGS
jgi:mannitol-1-/sugar-/sorbitol-6-phosphatase